MTEKQQKWFDVVIGNPPYQEEITTKTKRNKQKAVRNIFQFFQEDADKLSDVTCLIYPGGRWLQHSGKGMKLFGLKQVNDPNLMKVVYYPNANDIFSNVGISDGISIVLKNNNYSSDQFEYEFVNKNKTQSLKLHHPDKQILLLDPNDYRLARKVKQFAEKYHLSYLHKRTLPKMLFGIQSSFVEDHPDLIHPFKENYDQKKFYKLFSNDKAGKMGRAKWFLLNKSASINRRRYISEYQVVVSSANAGGFKRDRKLALMDNQTVFGRSRVALASFKRRIEAENFMKYVDSWVIRYLYLITGDALATLGSWAIDVGNYNDNNGLINFNQDIDIQLQCLIGLTDNDFDYIVNYVKSIRQ